MTNIRTAERFLRAALGVVFALLGYFWLATPWSWLAYAVAALMLVTAALRFCPLYGLIGVRSLAAPTKGPSTIVTLLSVALLFVLAGGGAYASAFLSRKFFIEDFNAMNQFYKQTLFLTGKNQRDDAVANLDKLKPALAAFAAKYQSYHPYDLKGDQQLNADLESVSKMVEDADPVIRTGDLHEAHLQLEKVRPVFQEMFKRNGFSMLSVMLVDFHDSMETILATATAKDAAGTLALYPAVSDKLKLVEAEANDAEIQAIRSALEDLKTSAESNSSETLPGKGDALKTNFVKVYLKRG